MADEWISPETEQKERDFAGVLRMHVNMCKGILARHGRPPYLYVDCHAGPGNLEYHGRAFAGSPLIFRDIAVRANLDYEAIHFEQDSTVAARLEEALHVPVSLLDWPDPEAARVYVERCETGLPKRLAEIGRRASRHGLVYADPIGTEIPAALLATVARSLPRTDILAYLSATNYKRRNGAGVGVRLAEHIAEVQQAGKRFVLVRRGLGKHQWTFVLWTDWDGFPAWESNGFYRIDSAAGKAEFRRLNYTVPELHELTNTPLWGEGDGVLPAASA